MTGAIGTADSNTVLNSIRDRIARGVPLGWQLTTLGECFKWASGGTPSRTKPSYFGGNIPWAVIGDLNDGILTATQSSITEAGIQNSSAKWVEPGSVLVAMYGSIGKLAISGRRLTTNQAIAFTNPDPIDPKYLYYYLIWQRPSLTRLGKGATQQNISQTVLREFPFVLAPPDEQRRVVAEIEKQFSRLDKAVAFLRRAEGNIRGLASIVLQIASDAPPPQLVSRLVDACHIVSGYAFKSDEFCSEGVPVVKIANVGYGEFVWKDQQYLPSALLSRYATFEVKPGDVLMALTRPVTDGKLKVCRYPDGAPPALLNQRVALLRAQSSGDAKYLLAQMRSPGFRREVLAVVSQTLQPNLSPVALKEFEIPWPGAEARRSIAADVDRRLSIVREVEGDLYSNLNRAQVLRQAVLAKAFTVKAQDRRDRRSVS